MSDRPYTSRARTALDLADRAAEELGDEFLATEHLLLGLLAEPSSPAAQILHQLGVRAEDVRAHVVRMRAG